MKILKFKILFFLVFINGSVDSQELYGSIAYVVSKDLSVSKDQIKRMGADPAMQQMMIKNLANEQDFNLLLKFTPIVSESSVLEDLNQGSKLQRVSTIAGYGKVVYNKHQKDTLLLYDAKRYANVLALFPVFEWELINESKLIGDKVCYKAIATQTVENNMGIKKVPITAWYTKEIPLRIGPYIYTGLPGVVLEVNRMSSTIKAVKINISHNKMNHNIKVPKKNIIKKAELDSIAKRNFYARFNN